MIKLSDFSLGIIDVLAVLVPGAAIAWLLLSYAPAEIACLFDPRLTQPTCRAASSDSALGWGLFAFASFVLGHFVFMIGSKLDGRYDAWRARTKAKDADRAYIAAKELVGQVTGALAPGHAGGDFSVLKWSKAYLLLHAPAAYAEVERLEATQKLFRSLVIVSMAFALHFMLAENQIWLGMAAGATAALSFQRYRDQRWKMTELSFASTVIAHATSKRPG